MIRGTARLSQGESVGSMVTARGPFSCRGCGYMTLCLLNWDEQRGIQYSSNLPESEHALNSDKMVQCQVKLRSQSNLL